MSARHVILIVDMRVTNGFSAGEVQQAVAESLLSCEAHVDGVPQVHCYELARGEQDNGYDGPPELVPWNSELNTCLRGIEAEEK